MKSCVALLAVTMALVLFGGTSAALAQDEEIVDVPFKFVAGGVTHDPGKYLIRLNDDLSTLTLEPDSAKGHGIVLLPETRLGTPEKEKSSPSARVVFDKIGETAYLSEVWIPGEDGFLVKATKEKHTHQVLPLQKKTK